jgi:methyl-accepting chemotaxis protein
VAAEIRKLADQTSSATRQIGEQINAMQMMTGAAAQTMTAIQDRVLDLSVVSAEMSAASEEQSKATTMIADRARSAAQEVARVSTALGAIGGSHDMLAAAAEQVLATADVVHDRASTLDQRVSAFVEALAV